MDTIVHFSFLFLWARPHLVPENRPGSRPKKRGNSVTTKVGSWNIGLEVVQNQRVSSVKHGLTFPVYRWSIDAEMALLTRAECCRGDSVSSTALRCNLQGSIPCCMRTYQHCLDQQPMKRPLMRENLNVIQTSVPGD